MTKTTHYKTLGVSPNAPTEVIAAAQIALKQKYNPDNYQELNDKANAIAQLQKIDEACTILLDKNERKKYDNYLAFLADEAYIKSMAQSKPSEQTTTVPTPQPVKPPASPPPISPDSNKSIPTQPSNYQPPKKKQMFGKIFGVLVAIFLLWLIYAIASVGYDFYRMSKQGSTVNPADKIEVSEPQKTEQAGLIEIKNDNKENLNLKLDQLKNRLKTNEKQLSALWQSGSPEARQQFAFEQEDWENRTQQECQAMAKGATATEQQINQLQCMIVKIDARKLQMKRNFEEFEAARLAEEANAARLNEVVPTEETTAVQTDEVPTVDEAPTTTTQ